MDKNEPVKLRVQKVKVRDQIRSKVTCSKISHSAKAYW